MWQTWYRMPDEEYNVYHRFMPYFVIGQLDYSKEVLLPKKKTFPDGTTQNGYDVFNPLYCYEDGHFSFKRKMQGKDPVTIERAAIIVNRGWIPEYLKDRRSRPHEVNTRKL